MLSTTSGLRRTHSLALAALGTLTLAGCIPATWLPDSSGFIYVKPIGTKSGQPPKAVQLMHFDLQNKNSRVVVQDIGATTMWPAVSPNGKLIAVSQFKGTAKEPKTVQMAFYDLQGKKVKESKTFAWSAAPKSDGGMLNSAGLLFWSPKDDMVLLTDASSTGIYNYRTDAMKVIDEALPVIHGGTPIRPDGKGFLAIMGDKKKGQLAFLDWTGAATKIDVSKLAAILPKSPKDPENEASGIAFTGALLMPSWWQGNAASVGFKRKKETYTIDTAGKTLVVSEGFAGLVKGKKEFLKEAPVSFDFSDDITVLVMRFPDTPQTTGQKKEYSRVSIVNHKTNFEHIVLAKAPSTTMFLPSPNGQYLALCLGDPIGGSGDPAYILVISNDGTLHSKITLEQS